MALRYRVHFISLRTGTHYVANIYDGNYTGEPTTLRGGAEPFVTEESRDEDMFVPLRTQTGYLRIFDNGFAADGTTRFDWHTLIPDTDLSLRVNLTAEGVIVWQGFLQAQNFGSELYGGPQVREYPVQCMLSAMSAISVPTDGKSVHNFAYVIREAFAALPLPDNSITTFVFQGGDDARQWLNKKIMWYNFLNRESDGGYVAKYDYQQVLEDICQYWGWTCRTYGQTVVFAAAYDGNHTDALILSQSNLNNLADEIDSTAGTVTDFFSPKPVGNIFSSTNQDATLARGYSKATVKSDINRQSPGFTFAPEAVRDILDAAGPYSWVGDGRVGYYTTPLVTAFTTGFMTGLADSMTGFCRRQIFSSEEGDGTNYDIINLSATASRNGSVSLDSIQPVVYAEGSIKITGSVFVGAEMFNAETLDTNCVKAQLGIGTSRNTAKWFRCRIINGELVTAWSTEKLSDYGFLIKIVAGQLDYIGVGERIIFSQVVRVCKEIPLTEALFGNLYLDLISMDTDDTIEYQIGNLQVSYSRDDLVAPTGTSSPWRKATKQRESSAEYTARNSNKASDPWNADNIFATDKNGSMEYGFGLVMNSNLTFMQTADFNLTPMIPEQRLANLVAAYWAKARQVLSVELRAGAFGDPTRQGVTPRELLQLDNVDYYPLSVSHDWRDDVIKVVMIDNRP